MTPGLGMGHLAFAHDVGLVSTHVDWSIATQMPDELYRYPLVIILPYRDRFKHLREWTRRTIPRLDDSVRVILVEQSRDQRKFNRGALLNAGYNKATQGTDRPLRILFHDVDLVPNDELLAMYTAPWPQPVVHFACRFRRYNNNSRYFGGVVGYTTHSFPGFSNQFWGWGGEDDSLLNRTVYSIGYPKRGEFMDLERYPTARHKLRALAKSDRCSNKWELLESDDARTDNHKTLDYDAVSVDNSMGLEWYQVTIH